MEDRYSYPQFNSEGGDEKQDLETDGEVLSYI